MVNEESGKLYRIDFHEENEDRGREIMIAMAPGETPVIKMLMTHLKVKMTFASGVQVALAFEKGVGIIKSKEKEVISDKGQVYCFTFTGDSNNQEELLIFSEDEPTVVRMLIERMQISLMEASAFDVMHAYERGDGVIEINDSGSIKVDETTKSAKA